MYGDKGGKTPVLPGQCSRAQTDLFLCGRKSTPSAYFFFESIRLSPEGNPQHTVRPGMNKNPLQQGHFRWAAGVLVGSGGLGGIPVQQGFHFNEARYSKV